VVRAPLRVKESKVEEEGVEGSLDLLHSLGWSMGGYVGAKGVVKHSVETAC
jgi:hypothetical protein